MFVADRVLAAVQPPIVPEVAVILPDIVAEVALNAPALVTLNTELAPKDMPSVPTYTPAFASVKEVLPLAK